MVGAHRRLQHLRRQGHEVGVDRPGQHNRELSEARHLLEEPRIGFDRKPQFRRAEVEIGADQLAPFVLIDDDIGMLQLFAIFVSTVGAERARRQKPVAAGLAADRDLIKIERHHIAVE